MTTITCYFQIVKLKKFHVTEKTDLQDAFKNELTSVEQRHRKLTVSINA